MGKRMENLSGNPRDYRFHKDAFVEKFQPLTYNEIVTGKPLMVPIPNSKYVFHSKMQSCTTVYRFHQMNRQLIEKIYQRMTDTAKLTALQSEFSKEMCP